MADVSINELPVATEMSDDALSVVFQNYETKSIKGSLIKEYAKESVKNYATLAAQEATAEANAAKTAAQTAQSKAETAKAGADSAKSAAQTAQQAAERAVSEANSAVKTALGHSNTAAQSALEAEDAKEAIENMTVTAKTLAAGSNATVNKTVSGGVVKLELGIPKGVQGDNGEDAPTITDIGINSAYHLIITMSDGTSYDAGYCRGASGAGTGDMMSSTYDPQGKNRDIFKYVDDQMANVDFDITADEVTFADGETFQQKFDQGELRGQNGSNGVGIKSVTQTTTSSADGGTNVITVTKTDNTTSTFNVKNGSKGSAGNDGVGIKSVTQTTTSDADGGENVITVTKTDNTTSTFKVKNGSKGSTGDKGANATINGVNALTIEAGENVTLSQSGSTATISASGGGKQFFGTIHTAFWSSDNGYSVVSGFGVAGLKASYKVAPTIDVVLTGTDAAADKELLEAFGKIAVVTTGDNYADIKAIGDPPTINIPIVINVWE